MKRRVICIAATALCMAMTSMAYAKEIETTTEEDEAMEYFNKVTERYQVEAEEADVQDIDIVYIVDQTALDEKTSVLCHIDDGD